MITLWERVHMFDGWSFYWLYLLTEKKRLLPTLCLGFKEDLFLFWIGVCVCDFTLFLSRTLSLSPPVSLSLSVTVYLFVFLSQVKGHALVCVCVFALKRRRSTEMKFKNCCLHVKSSEVDISLLFQVHFTEALDLVRGRRVYLHRGFAYVPQDDLVSILLTVYRIHLSHSLAVRGHNRGFLGLLPFSCQAEFGWIS